MRTICGIGTLALVALGVVGCSAASSPAPAATSSSGVASPSPTTATENQVASIIATHYDDWMAVSDGAVNCFSTRAIDPDSLEALTCDAEEATAALTAKSAAADLRALTVPASMDSLVTETLDALDSTASTEAVTTVCDVDPESQDCVDGRAAAMTVLVHLGDTLPAWQPYI